MAGIDQAGALAAEPRRQQLSQRHVDEPWIADVAIAVRECQPRRLEEVVPHCNAALVRQVEVAENVQRLAYGRAAARRGRHRVDVIAAVANVGRRHERRRVPGEIGQGQLAGERGQRRARRKRQVVHRVDDVGADRTAVEGANPLTADLRVGACEIPVAHHRADPGQVAAREELRGRGAELIKPKRVLADLLAQRRVDLEPGFGDVLGRREVGAEAEAAPLVKRLLPGHQRPRNADRQPAGDRSRERQRLAGLRIDEQVRVGGGRRGLAPVDRVHAVRTSVVIDEVAAATDPGDERIGHPER